MTFAKITKKNLFQSLRLSENVYVGQTLDETANNFESVTISGDIF